MARNADDHADRICQVERTVAELCRAMAEVRGLVSDVEAQLGRMSGRPLRAITTPGREREPYDPGCVKALYSRRFSAHELQKKRVIWRGLAPFWAARFPPNTQAVLEIGAGDGEFPDHVVAARRVAVDLNPNVERLRARAIEGLVGDATRLYDLLDNDSFDVVFCSNVLEYLYDRDQVHLLIREVRHILRPGGRFLLLQPNIRHVGPAYYDFIDHRIELTAEALVEALEVGQFTLIECVQRFLPYTSKSHLSRFYWLVPLYIRLPIAWRLFGAQAFIVAEKHAASG
jgi:SAM-dependent methyltransferase